MRTTSAATRSSGRRRKTDGRRGARIRFGFTLLELLVIIGILGVLASISVASLGKGTGAARMRGSVRDVFATVRIARSTALVTQKPCVMSFSTRKGADGEWGSKVEIAAADMMKSGGATVARTIGGEWRSVGSGEPAGAPAEGADGQGGQSEPAPEGGETLEEMLFEPVSEEVFKGVCLKVLTADERLALPGGEVDEAKRSTISVFSNVDYLLGKYRQDRDKKKKAEAAQDETPAPAPAGGTETDGESQEKDVVWQVNGRCEPHTIYIYAAGTDPAAEGWRIVVDRFGAAKILAPGEIEE